MTSKTISLRRRRAAVGWAPAICAGLFLCIAWSTNAQIAPGLEPPATSTGTGTGTGTDSDSTSMPVADDATETQTPDAGIALSASRIMALAQENAEVLVELKSVTADALAKAGAPIPADAMSDEQFFNAVAASRPLRVQITYFLRARGYISDQDLARNGEFDPTLTSPDGMRGNASALDAEGNEQSLRSADLLRGSGDISALRSQDTTPARNRTQASTRTQTETNITDPPKALHRPAPYNLLSLRDLYTQVPESPERLKRFGMDVFSNRMQMPASARTQSASIPMDIPLGPDYVLGPGDELAISIWGGVSQTLIKTIDRGGAITLPEAGQIQVAGLTLAKGQDAISGALRPQFRNAQVAVTVSRLRTIRVYVVGDVQRPGAYDISSLASPLSALSAAGGPTAVGSLRVMRQLRNDKVIGEIDLYDFLLHGVRSADSRLQGGDTLVVLPAGPQVAVYGAVKRPAIYELRGEKTLPQVLDEAGGITVAAELGAITINRVVEHNRREEFKAQLNPGDAGSTTILPTEVKDGDRIHVGTVLPETDAVVYLEGHVARPGRMAYHDGIRLSDVIASYRDLLPEPAPRGEIVRLTPPDLHPETFSFDVPSVLNGNFNLPLQQFDTVRVFGRYEQDAPTVTVRGEVERPGVYPMFEGMTAAQLVRAAGGFKRDALLEQADLVSYVMADGTGVTIQRQSVRIGDAVLSANRAADSVLKPGDVLTVQQLTGWNDIGASMRVEGEVAHPGSYGIEEGEHLSAVLRRAGGYRKAAYPEGAVLVRSEVRELEEKSRDELIRQIETSSASARLSPGLAGGDQSSTLQLIQQQQDQVLAKLRSEPPSGRLVIQIDGPIESWANTAADVEVRSGDELRIPKEPGFVLVSGQVYNASAITFAPGKSAAWYLERAGGPTQIANRKEIFIVRANGTVVGRRSEGWYDRNVLSTKLDPGDMIVVPQKIVGSSLFWRNLIGTAQVASSIAVAAVLAGL